LTWYALPSTISFPFFCHILCTGHYNNFWPCNCLQQVDHERDGQLIDRALVKDVLDIYLEIGRGSMAVYEQDFEEAFCKGTADYYSKKAQTWMLEDSCAEYMFKVST
jgi:hypothetical protein